MVKIPIDKQLHFFSGGFLAAISFALMPSAWVAIFATAFAATLKEVYDSFHPENHTADEMDFIATLLGGATVLFSFWIGPLFR